MMLNRKKLGLLAISGAITLACAACGDDTDTTSNTDAGGSNGDGGGGANGDGGGGANGDGGGANGDGGGSGGANGDGGGSTDPKPRGPTAVPTLGAQIDRMGRPAINTALNATFEADMAKKDAAKNAYNAASADKFATFTAEIQANLAILDALDGNCGNQFAAAKVLAPNRYETLAGVLANDQIFVNTASEKCGTYLGLEAAFVTGGDVMGTCGGRTPNDDVIDRSYSVLAAGILDGVGDGIAKDDATHDLTKFPWLAAPQN